MLGCLLVAYCRGVHRAVQGDFGACVPFKFSCFPPNFLLRNLKKEKKKRKGKKKGRREASVPSSSRSKVISHFHKYFSSSQVTL